MTCSLVARNIVRSCSFPVGRPFSCSSAGRPSLRWVGLKTASLQPAPVRAAPVRAACCRGLRVRRAWRSLFFVFIPSHACRPSGQPFFSSGFRVFPMLTCKCVCVCVSVRTCTICLHMQHLTAPAQFYRLRSDFLLPPPAFPQRSSVSWTPASSSWYSDGLALQLAPHLFDVCR